MITYCQTLTSYHYTNVKNTPSAKNSRAHRQTCLQQQNGHLLLSFTIQYLYYLSGRGYSTQGYSTQNAFAKTQEIRKKLERSPKGGRERRKLVTQILLTVLLLPHRKKETKLFISIIKSIVRCLAQQRWFRLVIVLTTTETLISH